MFNIRDFGAKGDKQANDQTSIQSAIETCHKSGGGTVYLPAGNYLSGALHLLDHVNLHLDAGATLWASKDPAHYQNAKTNHLYADNHLLYAEDAEHISVTGNGIIHGQGTEDYGSWWGVPDKPDFRTGILLFQGCRNITIRDVKLLYSDSWNLHLRRCENAFIDGVTIINNIHRLNSDGIDPNSCKNVHISNCHIVAGDDCIVLKATQPYPCENIVVTNCTLETTCAALKLGTESQGDFRDIHFSNCTIRNTPVGIGFYMKDGATMERVTFSNISIENCDPAKHQVFPVFMDIEKRHEDSKIGKIRDISFRDIHIRTGSGILIQGMPESSIENLSLQNITMRVDEADNYEKRHKAVGGARTTKDERDTKYAQMPSYATLAYVNGLTVENLRVLVSKEAIEQYNRSALCCNESSNAVIRNVHGAAVNLHNCQSVR